MPKLNILNVSERTGTEDSRAVSLSVKDIPIGEISVKANVRTEYDSLDELMASIRQYGLLQPITVYKDGGAYHVKTGHRRFLAFKALYDESPDRFHSIRCIVSDAENIPIIQLIENVQRLDLSQLDLFNALNALKAQGLSLKQIADILGKTESYIKKIFTGINEIRLEPELKDYIGSAGGTIQDVLETSGIPNKEERLSLLEQRKEGSITRAQLRKKARDLKGISLENSENTDGDYTGITSQNPAGGSAGGTSPQEDPHSSAGGTIPIEPPQEPEKSYPVRLTANREQRRIYLSFDNDEPYTQVYTDLKNLFDKHHLVCIEQELAPPKESEDV
jgi:ParB family chromosome partitioning protein